jgi:hypothetical protein
MRSRRNSWDQSNLAEQRDAGKLSLKKHAKENCGLCRRSSRSNEIAQKERIHTEPRRRMFAGAAAALSGFWRASRVESFPPRGIGSETSVALWLCVNLFFLCGFNGSKTARTKPAKTIPAVPLAAWAASVALPSPRAACPNRLRWARASFSIPRRLPASRPAICPNPPAAPKPACGR